MELASQPKGWKVLQTKWVLGAKKERNEDVSFLPSPPRPPPRVFLFIIKAKLNVLSLGQQIPSSAFPMAQLTSPCSSVSPPAFRLVLCYLTNCPVCDSF